MGQPHGAAADRGRTGVGPAGRPQVTLTLAADVVEILGGARRVGPEAVTAELYRPSKTQQQRIAYRRRQAIRSVLLAALSTAVVGTLLLVGITIHLFTQLFVMVGGTLNLLPLTGITVPFLSQEGIALVVNLTEVGVAFALMQRLEARS